MESVFPAVEQSSHQTQDLAVARTSDQYDPLPGVGAMICLLLNVEALGYRLVKGDLHWPIGVSIDATDHIGRRNRERTVTSGDLRNRTAEALLRLRGGELVVTSDCQFEIIRTGGCATDQVASHQKQLT